MINTLNENRRTNRHKIMRLFFISLNISDYNIKLPRIYSPAKPKSFGKSPHTNGIRIRIHHSPFLLGIKFVCFTALPFGRLLRYAHASLKTSSKNLMGKNGSWREEYIAFVNCIAYVVSLKTLCEKLSNKNSHRKKEYNI